MQALLMSKGAVHKQRFLKTSNFDTLMASFSLSCLLLHTWYLCPKLFIWVLIPPWDDVIYGLPQRSWNILSGRGRWRGHYFIFILRQSRYYRVLLSSSLHTNSSEILIWAVIIVLPKVHDLFIWTCRKVTWIWGCLKKQFTWQKNWLVIYYETNKLE